MRLRIIGIVILLSILPLSSLYALSRYGKVIELASLENNEELFKMESLLNNRGDMAYLEIYKKFYKLSYSRLVEIYDNIKDKDMLDKLNRVVRDVMAKYEEEGCYWLSENIIINNRPELLRSPFYSGDKYIVTELKPYAERLYFCNLWLNYKKNNLNRVSDTYLTGVLPVKEIHNYGRVYEDHPAGGIKLYDIYNNSWSFKLPADNLSNFVVSPVISVRQRIKKYEENSFSPVSLGSLLICRNEYRLFGIDSVTGMLLWTFTVDKNNNEYYQTIRHPHHNTYAYGLSVSDDTVYSELAGQLVAVRIKENKKPRLLWQANLGEYYIAVKPIHTAGGVIAGLINARGELWICSFAVTSGKIKWNTYVGVTSYLSPASDLIITDGAKVIVGTNHGVLVCIDAYNGEIAWIKKYKSRRYNIVKYWQEGEYRGKFTGKGYIKYDTQFMRKCRSGHLYFKPRESEYLYIYNCGTGQPVDAILINSNKYCLIDARDGRVVLLEKNNGLESAEIKVLEIESGEKIFSRKIQNGELRGVLYPDRNTVILKIDNYIHLVRFANSTVEYKAVAIDGIGWLSGIAEGFIFTAEGKKIFAAANSSTKNNDINLNKTSYEQNPQYLVHSILAQESSDSIKKESFSRLLALLENNICLLEKIMPVIYDNIESVKSSKWRSFFSKLSKLYGDSIITYRDISLRLAGFFFGAGLIDDKNKDIGIKIKKRPGRSGFSLNGARINLVPVNVIKGPEEVDFMLLLNFDQLICIDNSGNIIWARRIYYIQKKAAYNRLQKLEDMVSLYGNILIINDGVNIVAVDVNDGRYIWSISKDVSNKKRFLWPSRKLKIQSLFLGENLIVLQGNRIYSVKPENGFCARMRELTDDTAEKLASANGNIYIVYSPDRIVELNRELSLIREYGMEIPGKIGRDTSMVFSGDNILLAVPHAGIYALDRNSGNLCASLSIGETSGLYLTKHKESIIIFNPYRSILSVDKSLKLKWQVDLESDNLANLVNYRTDSIPFFQCDNKIIFVTRKKGKYYINAVNAETGKRIFVSLISEARGFLIYLSNYARLNNNAVFILSTGLEDYDEERNYYDENRDLPLIYVKSRLYSLEVNTGLIGKLREFPAIGSYGMQRNMLIKRNKRIYYSVNGDLISKYE